MVQVTYYNNSGNQIGTLEVDETIFGKKIKKRLLHQLIIGYEANKRQGTACTKRKSEVEGSGIKPWPQKHTGRARHGMRRSPIWRKGGITHGPKPRDYSQTLTKKMRRAGLNSALLGKLVDNEVKVIDNLSPAKPKTKEVNSLIKKIGYNKSLLIAIHQYDKKAHLSARNIPNVMLLPVSDINAYHLLRYNNTLFTKPAFEKIIKERNGQIKENISGESK